MFRIAPIPRDAIFGPPRRATQAKVWIRRLYADPTTGRLIHRDTTRRLFTGALRDFLIARDQYCSTPWCGAPVAHLDHQIPHRDGGPTDQDNGRGLCARCNLHKEHPRHTPTPDPLDPPEILPGFGFPFVRARP